MGLVLGPLALLDVPVLHQRQTPLVETECLVPTYTHPVIPPCTLWTSNGFVVHDSMIPCMIYAGVTSHFHWVPLLFVISFNFVSFRSISFWFYQSTGYQVHGTHCIAFCKRVAPGWREHEQAPSTSTTTRCRMQHRKTPHSWR